MKEYLKTKVTRINGNFHCRLIDARTDKVLSEVACQLKQDIGYCIRYLMRWHDKCGGTSRMADRSRHRIWEKTHAAGEKIKGEPAGKVWYPSQLPL
jgi:hypothetical protein